VVTVTSVFARLGRIEFADLQGSRRYRPIRAYNQSKLANILFTRALARRVAGTGITATCVDPALAATDILRDHAWWNPRWLQIIWKRFLLTPEAAARRVIHAASSPAAEGLTGVCLGARGRVLRTPRRSRDDAAGERLWEVSAELVGLETRGGE
jgi:NAD(P)-dependent dehydrogenase (short-subunit alcohol dehydrogenase family)